MKKFLNIFGIVAIVATMLSGCTSDVKEDITIPTQKRIVTVTANVDEASRTVLDEEHMRVKWDENDYQQMQLIELGRNNDGDEWVEIQRATADKMDSIDGGETATFTFSLTDATRSTYSQFQYRAILIYDDEEMGYGTQKEYYIKNTQNASATSFDPRADILIAKPQTFNAVQNSLSFEFARAVAITKMTITGLAAGEDVRSVSFLTYLGTKDAAEQYGASIVGKVVPTYDASGNGTIQLVDGAASYDNKRVTMSYTTEEATASGFDVYFVTMPVELTQGFTVRVVTESNFYQKQIDLATAGKSLSLVLNKLNKFSVALSNTNIVEPSETEVYKKVTKANTLTAGDELILVCTSKNVVATNVINNNVISQTAMLGTVDAITPDSSYGVFTLGGSEGAWTLTNDGQLLGATAVKKLAWGSGTTTWSISIDANGDATIQNGTTSYGTLQYNYNNGTNPRFLNYTSSQTAIQIYRKESILSIPSINLIDAQEIVANAANHTIEYTMSGGADDFAVSGHSDWITKASIDTPGVISYTVSKNTTGSNRQGNIIIQSEAHPDVTYQIDITQTTEVLADPFVGSWFITSSNNGASHVALKSDLSLQSITIADENVKINDTTNDCEYIITAVEGTIDQYTIQNKNNQYLKWSNSTTIECVAEVSANGACYWQITKDTDNNLTIKNVASSDRELLYSTTTEAIKAYASSNAVTANYCRIVLRPFTFLHETLATPELSTPVVSAEKTTITTTWQAVTGATGYDWVLKSGDETIDSRTGNIVANDSCLSVDGTTVTLTITAETVFAAGDYTLSVTATSTNTERYTASEAATTNLTVSDGGGSGAGTKYFVKITSTAELESGKKYLIVYETGSLVFDGSLTTNLDTAQNKQAVTISDSKIDSSETIGYAFTISTITGGYSIQSASGYYIGRTTNSNGMNTTAASAYVNTITFEDANAVIKGSANAVLRYNSDSGQERFRYFKSSTYTDQKAIQLYKLED